MLKNIRAGLALSSLAIFGGSGAAMASSVEIYSNNFDSAAIYGSGVTGGLSGITTTTGVQGLPSPFSGNMLWNSSGSWISTNPTKATTLTLTGLPEHSSISLQFLLAILDSWDGDATYGGPDSMNIKVDGVQIFSHLFNNSQGHTTYTFPAGTLLAPKQQMFGWTAAPDFALDMSADPLFQSIAHTSSKLVVEWTAGGANWEGGSYESWAIDNVKVTLNGVASPVPEPAALGLLAVGLMGTGAALRRRRA